jgi:hypothetical protein
MMRQQNSKDLQRFREEHEREREQRELPELIAVDLACRAGARPTRLRGRRPGRRRADAGAEGPDLDGGDGGRLVRPCRGAGGDLGLPRFEMARGDGSVVFVSGGGNRGACPCRDMCGALERDCRRGWWWEVGTGVGERMVWRGVAQEEDTRVNSGVNVKCLFSDTVNIQSYTCQKYTCCQLRGAF